MLDQREDLRSLKIGTKVADYQIVGVLGQGAFGITYLATDVNLQIRVAIKEYFPREFSSRSTRNSVRPSGSKNDKDFFEWGRERFLSEARILARLDHPNIVAVRRLLEENQTAYLVMDYCDGRPLDEIIELDGPLSTSAFRKLFWPILDALEHVHKAGLIHRDVKPANIYIRSDGSPVLLDFGAARNDISQHSRSVTSLATAGYAPLEQYDTRGNQGAWSDIYGFSATLYRALTGERPPDAAGRVVKDTLEPLSKKLGGKVEERVLSAIDKGLAVFPNARPQSIAEWKCMFSDETFDKKAVEVGQSKSISGSEAKATLSTPQNAASARQKREGNSLLIWGSSLVVVVGLLFWFSQRPDLTGSSQKGEITAINVASPSGSDVVKDDSKRAQESKENEKVGVPTQKDAGSAARAKGVECPANEPSSRWTDCKGSQVFDNGDRYTGSFQEGKAHGFGTLWLGGDRKGESYVGEFRGGQHHGKGTYTFSNGNRYVGDWRNGRANGRGTLFLQDGEKYEGGFKDNRFDGKGIYIYAKGDKYEGEFKNGNFEGKGKYTFKSGSVFEGTYVSDKRHGRGVYTWDSGTVQESTWVDGEEQNPVTVRFKSGDTYVGDVNLQTGEWEGRGTYVFKDGRRYVGEFKAGKRNGFGTSYLADGNIERSGFWRDGEYVSTSSSEDRPQPSAASNVPPAFARASRAIPLRAQDKALMNLCDAEAKEVKKALPQTLDLLTTAVDARCIQSERGVLFVYKYDYNAVIKWDSSGAEHHRNLRQETVKNFCENSVLRGILAKIDVEHHYHDTDKKLGMVVRITREDCP